MLSETTAEIPAEDSGAIPMPTPKRWPEGTPVFVHTAGNAALRDVAEKMREAAPGDIIEIPGLGPIRIVQAGPYIFLRL